MLPGGRAYIWEEPDKQEDHRDAKGKVNVEDPVPGEIVRNEAPQGRPDDGGESEDGGDQTLVLATLRRGKQVTNDDKGVGHHYATANPLKGTEDYQLRQGLAET